MNRFQMKDQQVEVHVLTLVNWVKITEDLSKIVQGELFGTFHNQYQIIPNKDTYFVRLAYPVKNLSTIPAEFQWNSTGVMENYWKMTGTNGTSGISLKFRWNPAEIQLEFQQFKILIPLKFHL